MKILIKNKTHITNALASIDRQIRSRLTLFNPKWIENERLGRWNGDTPQKLRFYETDGAGGLIVPRGLTGQLVAMAQKDGINFHLVDETQALPTVEIDFQGELRPFQASAVNEMLIKRFGSLSAPTGSGKTVMGLYLIAKRKQPALVVVHTKELLNQWIARAETFLGIPIDEIGVIGSGKKRIGERLTVATVQSLVKRADEVAPYIGHLIVDECHRTPSKTFTEVVTAFDCRYMTGLSATPWRRDKLSKLIFWHLGDLQHQVDKVALENAGHILKAQVITRKTSFRSSVDPSTEYSQMLKELTEDPDRNRLIASDVAGQIGHGGVALVLSDRKSHCLDLQEMLKNQFGINAEVLTGDVPTHQREEIVSRINAGKVPVLVATGQLIGEGFDCKHLSTLFLATPIRFSGRLLQYVGRILRPGPGKEIPKVFDYVDGHVGPLAAAAKARQRVYSNAA